MSDGSEPAASERPVQGQVRIEKLYLKDASFESPNTPAMFQQEWKPEIELNINTRSERVAASHFEVVVTDGCLAIGFFQGPFGIEIGHITQQF